MLITSIAERDIAVGETWQYTLPDEDGTETLFCEATAKCDIKAGETVYVSFECGEGRKAVATNVLPDGWVESRVSREDLVSDAYWQRSQDESAERFERMGRDAARRFNEAFWQAFMGVV